MLTVWIAPTGVQGLTRSCPGLAMGAGQPEHKAGCAANLLSLRARAVTWLVDLGLPCRQLGQCAKDLSASSPDRVLEMRGNPFVRLEQESSHWDIASRTR